MHVAESSQPLATPRASIAGFSVPILIVSYATPEDVAACLGALGRFGPTPSFEVFIAENGGRRAYDELVSALIAERGPCAAPDGPLTAPVACEGAACQVTLRLVHDAGEPGALVHVGQMAENEGYAGGVNAWLRPLLNLEGWNGAWVLNPDTIPHPAALAELSDYASAHGKGLVGSRLVSSEDGVSLDTRGMAWRKFRGAVEGIDKYALAAPPPDVEAVERRLDSPCGASTFATRQLIEDIGPMREHYFLFFEDLEWGIRAKERGYAIGYAHDSVVFHTGGRAIGSAPRRRDRSRLSVYLESRNRLLFVREHYPGWLWWSAAIGVAESVAYALAGSASNAVAALDGLAAGISGKTGRPAGFSALAARRRRTPLKKRLKVVISATFWLGLSAWRRLRRFARPDSSLVILYYHGVDTAHRQSFARQLEILQRHADVVAAGCIDKHPGRRRRVAITFDDGLTSIAENALPELGARGMHCTIFFPSGGLGGAPQWATEAEHDPNDPIMPSDSVKALPPDLVEIGAHSVTHPRLTNVSVDVARGEIAGSKASLEQLTGQPVSLFAFPYGAFNGDVVQICVDEGFGHAFSIRPQVIDLRRDGVLRGRTLVEADDGPMEFFLKASGAYAWSGWLQNVRAALRRGPSNPKD